MCEDHTADIIMMNVGDVPFGTELHNHADVGEFIIRQTVTIFVV